MQNKPRHVCAFCGKKRIESRMKAIPVITPDDKISQGKIWACFFDDYWNGAQNHYVAYLERRKGEFYLYGDKCASAIKKAGALPFVPRES